jgi:Fe-S-cluster containining protein
MANKPERSPFYTEGLRFSCTRCSTCCRFESGFVFLSEKDTSVLTDALCMKFEDFIDTYCRWIPSMNGIDKLSLKEKSNKDCIFWALEPNAGCLIYNSRPLQCRSFPFWSSILNNKTNWALTAKSCPGMDNGNLFSQDSIKEWLVMQENEMIISRHILSKGEF